MKDSALLGQIALLLLFLAMWELAVGAGLGREIIFSRPTRVFGSFLELLSSSDTWRSVAVTLRELLSGLAIGSVAGVGAALLISRHRFLRRAFDPLILAFYSLPRLALVPLLIVWFGIGLGSKIAVATIHGFVIMLLATYAGLDNVNQRLVDSLRQMGAGTVGTIRWITMPATVPQLIVGLRQAVGLAWGSVIVAELVGSFSGLGYEMGLAVARFDMTMTLAWLIVASLVATSLDLLIRSTERLIVRWR